MRLICRLLARFRGRTGLSFFDVDGRRRHRVGWRTVSTAAWRATGMGLLVAGLVAGSLGLLATAGAAGAAVDREAPASPPGTCVSA